MPPRDYSELDETEQDAILERHLATAPERLDGFRREAGELELDGTPESLVAVWEWFLRRNVEGNRPAQAAETPDWYEPDPPELAPQRLPPATLRDVDGIGLYLAEVLRRERPELEWKVGRLPKRMQYALQGKPVLQTAGGFDLDPLGVVYALAVRAMLLGTGREPKALQQAYEANVGALEPR
jgi:hypothetical protein